MFEMYFQQYQWMPEDHIIGCLCLHYGHNWHCEHITSYTGWTWVYVHCCGWGLVVCQL